MKISLFAALLLVTFNSVQGQGFKTVKIGKQVWMATNLSIDVEGSWAYNEDPAMEAKYGRLYTWEAALKACPKGWHLPTVGEWIELIDFLGGEDKAGKLLKTGGGIFDAKLAGMTGVGNYRLLHSYGAFWTATPADKSNAWFIYLCSDNNAATSTYSVKTHGLSVRYIKD